MMKTLALVFLTLLSLVLAEGQQTSKRFHISVLSVILSFSVFILLIKYYYTTLHAFLNAFSGLDFAAQDDPFSFDYHRLRVGGLILAAVLCLIGITILLSGHCRCKFNQDKRRRTGSNAQAMLNDTARASEC
uniref:FXYD domain-containing ion transport regulator n=1 Tax=Cyprinus carpio carpio TaxID=630221 RepID=A0A9J8CLC8_CYPCA